MRVEGNVDNRVTGTHAGGHTVLEVFHCPAYVHLSRSFIKNLVGGKELAFVFVDFLTVIGKCPMKGIAYTDFCDHRSSNLWVSSTI